MPENVRKAVEVAERLIKVYRMRKGPTDAVTADALEILVKMAKDKYGVV